MERFASSGRSDKSKNVRFVNPFNCHSGTYSIPFFDKFKCVKFGNPINSSGINVKLFDSIQHNL